MRKLNKALRTMAITIARQLDESDLRVVSLYVRGVPLTTAERLRLQQILMWFLEDAEIAA